MPEGRGFEVAIEEDYRLYRKLYRREVYDRYAGRCTDTKLMVFRKRPARRAADRPDSAPTALAAVPPATIVQPDAEHRGGGADHKP